MRRLILAGAAIALLAGCGGPTAGAGGDEAKKDIVIGVIADLTGATADVGKPTNEGLLAYVDNLNAKGGVQGHKIKLLNEKLVANAADVGGHLMTKLKALADKHPLIGDVRGRGLMIGVELVRDRQTKERATDERNAVVLGAFARGLLILGAGKNSVRFSPPLILTREQADIAVKILDEALTEVESSRR